MLLDWIVDRWSLGTVVLCIIVQCAVIKNAVMFVLSYRQQYRTQYTSIFNMCQVVLIS